MWKILSRPPDLIIGTRERPQTLRWDLFKLWGIQFALHRWLRSDSDRALHDHSADNISVLLTGPYREWFSHEWEKPYWKLRLPLIPYRRQAELPHRVELHNGPVWTLWIRFKPRREWGFWCQNKGWVRWQDYIAERDGYDIAGVSSIGRGCG